MDSGGTPPVSNYSKQVSQSGKGYEESPVGKGRGGTEGRGYRALLGRGNRKLLWQKTSGQRREEVRGASPVAAWGRAGRNKRIPLRRNSTHNGSEVERVLFKAQNGGGDRESGRPHGYGGGGGASHLKEWRSYSKWYGKALDILNRGEMCSDRYC